jgi:peptide/nickel transport system permease protein
LTKSLIKNIGQTLLLVFLGSFFVFFISKKLPYDSVDKLLAQRGIDPSEINRYDAEYEKLYKANNLHKPLFYFTIEPSNHYPQLNSIVNKKERNKILNATVDVNKTKSGFFYPVFYWHGTDNQYHIYIDKLFSGDPGSSIIDGKPILTKIWNALMWSSTILFVSLVCSILLSLSIVYFTTMYNRQKLIKGLLLASSFSQAFPVFIFATLVLIFLTNDQIGVSLFDMPLNVITQEGSFFSTLTSGFSRYIPAVFCLIIFDTLYLIRLLFTNVEEEKKQPYIEVMHSRKISEDSIIRKHIFPNVMIPFTTLIIGSLPAGLAGTLLLEVIFNIPGMGRLIYESINGQDWNIVYTIVIIFIVISIIIFKFNDLLIRFFDKRIPT